MTELRVEYRVYRGEVDTGMRLQAYGDDNGTITMDATAAIKLSLTAKLLRPTGMDFISDRLRPYLLIDGAEHPLGVYVVTTAPVSREQDREYVEVEAYGLSYLLSECTVGSVRFYAAGMLYTDIFRALLTEGGIPLYVVDESTAVLAQDREWEAGTSLLDILNELLPEVNYDTVWETLDGMLMCRKARDATAENLDIVYRADEYSLLYPEASTDEDTFSRANHFVAISENSDADLTLVAEATNERADSPISTVRQGRVVTRVEQVDGIASQAELDTYVQRMLMQSMMRTATTTFYTGPNPVHTCYNIVQLENGYEDGLYQEIGWELNLAVDCKMTHIAKKVVYAL